MKFLKTFRLNSRSIFKEKSWRGTPKKPKGNQEGVVGKKTLEEIPEQMLERSPGTAVKLSKWISSAVLEKKTFKVILDEMLVETTEGISGRTDRILRAITKQTAWEFSGVIPVKFLAVVFGWFLWATPS